MEQWVRIRLRRRWVSAGVGGTRRRGASRHVVVAAGGEGAARLSQKYLLQQEQRRPLTLAGLLMQLEVSSPVDIVPIRWIAVLEHRSAHEIQLHFYNTFPCNNPLHHSSPAHSNMCSMYTYLEMWLCEGDEKKQGKKTEWEVIGILVTDAPSIEHNNISGIMYGSLQSHTRGYPVNWVPYFWSINRIVLFFLSRCQKKRSLVYSLLFP